MSDWMAERDRQLRIARMNRGPGREARRLAALEAAALAARPLVERWVARTTRDCDREDIVQSAMESAVRSIRRGRVRADEPRCFMAWLRPVADRAVCNHWRAVERERLAAEACADAGGPADAPSPSSLHDHHEAMRAAFGAVPARHRGDVCRYVLLDRPGDEVTHAGLTRDALYKNAERFRKRLRRSLGDGC